MNFEVKVSSIGIDDIRRASLRFDAKMFGIDARLAREMVSRSKYSKLRITDPKFVKDATYPLRFKRNYVPEAVGVPFILPSQIMEVFPRAAKWITTDSEDMKETLGITRGDLLLTRSGTVGKCSVAGDALAGCLLSDDLIRIRVNEGYLGLIYTFLTSRVGQVLLATSTYGAVIRHIEPSHLDEIEVPVPPKTLCASLDRKVHQAFSLIDESNALVNRARLKLLSVLSLPLRGEDRQAPSVRYFSVKSLTDELRIDASFHDPECLKVVSSLRRKGFKFKPIISADVSVSVFLPGRFKRVYVESMHGIPLIGGKQISNLDPRTEKYLAILEHGDRISEQLTIKASEVLVTRSGTIGKIAIAPEFWEGWAASEHILRIEAITPWMAGFIYTWLSTGYGQKLVQRFTYGAVVDEITENHLGQVVVPYLDESLMREIGEMILASNSLRTQAFEKLDSASKLFEREVLGNEGVKPVVGIG